MPYCHRCRSEYLDTVSVCPECGQALSPDPPPRAGDPSIRLTPVYIAHGEVDAQLIHALLEANGVESMLSGESVRLTHGLTVDGLAAVRILVRDEDAARAREVISASEHIQDCPHCGEPNPVSAAACRHCRRSMEPEAT